MSDDRIYIRFKGKTLGPMTFQRVQELVKRGQITRLHDLSSDGLSWVKAEEFEGLFQSASPQVEVYEPVAQSSQADSSSVNQVWKSSTEGTAFGSESNFAASAASPDASVEWYAHVANESKGPVSTAWLQSAISAGQVTRDTLIWRAGLDEWKPAVQVVPQWFGPAVGQSSVESHRAVQVQATRAAQSPTAGNNDVYYQLHRQRPWVLLLAFLAMAAGILSAIFWIVFMIAGAESRLSLQLSGATKVVWGLINLFFSMLYFLGGLLLYWYGASLKDIAIHRDPAVPAIAAQKLFQFWRYLGIVCLTFIGGTVMFILIAMALAAGLGAGASS